MSAGPDLVSSAPVGDALPIQSQRDDASRARLANPPELLSRSDFEQRFGTDVGEIPRNLTLVGWTGTSRTWCVCGDLFPQYRLWALLAFLESRLPSVLDGRPSWFLCCAWDGWRERIGHSSTYTWVDPDAADVGREWTGPPGHLPRFSPSRPRVVAFSAHRGDPSALLVPEATYLSRDHYRRLFLVTRLTDRPRWLKRPGAIYQGSDHGEPQSIPGSATLEHPRRALLHAAADLPNVEVGLSRASSLRAQVQSRRRQLAYRTVIDVDGYTRSWEAIAWKLSSRSTLLSQASIWDTWFTRQLAAWEHYVPMANDFADLAERVEWCSANEQESAEISARARAHASRIYDPDVAAAALEDDLEQLLHPSSIQAS